MTHQILLNFGQNLDKIDMKQLKKVSPRKKILRSGKSTYTAENSVFLRKSQKVEYRFPSFLVRKCKINFVSIKRKLDVDSFSTSGDIWARRWLRCHDLVSPGEKVDEKNFFLPNDSKWSNSQKKTLFQKFEKFLPLWPDPGSTLRKFLTEIFSTKKKLFFV